MFFTELNKKLRIRHRVLSRICIRSFYFILFFVFLVYYSCTFLLSRTMIFYSSVTKASSSSASSVSITSSVNAVSSFSKLSFTASALTASAFPLLHSLLLRSLQFQVPLPASLLLWHLYLTLRHDIFSYPYPPEYVYR